MGELNQHDLSRFNCDVFIETGTGKAVGTAYAASFPIFKQIHTIEVVPMLYEYSRGTLSDSRVTFHIGNSIDILQKLLPVFSKEDRILFWLDAHFPGADYQLSEYRYDRDGMPLDRELKVIRSARDIREDVFIIDDLRLYEDGPFDLGNSHFPIKKEGIGFIEEILGLTHSLKRDYRHQGFIIATPK
jgi:hypothetical protein